MLRVGQQQQQQQHWDRVRNPDLPETSWTGPESECDPKVLMCMVKFGAMWRLQSGWPVGLIAQS